MRHWLDVVTVVANAVTSGVGGLQPTGPCLILTDTLEPVLKQTAVSRRTRGE